MGILRYPRKFTIAQHPGLENGGMQKRRAWTGPRKEWDQNQGQQKSSAGYQCPDLERICLLLRVHWSPHESVLGEP